MFGFKTSNSESKELYMIMGCSRLGSSIAGLLSRQGVDVVVIDPDSTAFRKLPSEFSGFNIEGDASDFEVLKKAGIEKANVVVAVTNDDNINIMIAQIAKNLFNVGLVIARLQHDDKESLCNDMGIKTIYPNQLSLRAFELLCEELEEVEPEEVIEAQSEEQANGDTQAGSTVNMDTDDGEVK